MKNILILTTLIMSLLSCKDYKNKITKEIIKEIKPDITAKIIENKGFDFSKYDELIHKGFKIEFTNESGHDILSYYSYNCGIFIKRDNLKFGGNTKNTGIKFYTHKWIKRPAGKHWKNKETIIYEVKPSKYIGNRFSKFDTKYSLSQIPIIKTTFTLHFEATNEILDFKFNPKDTKYSQYEFNLTGELEKFIEEHKSL